MIRHFFCAFGFALLAGTLLPAADWAVFHGPNGDNKSPDTGLLKKWAEGGPKLLWIAETVGYGYSSVSVSGDRIYISGNVPREGKDLSMVFCFDKDGKQIWEKDNGPAHTESRTYPGTRGTPAVEGNYVFDASPLGQVTCYDTTNEGNKVWSRNLLEEYAAPMPRWIFGHSIVFDSDNVVCMVGGAKALAVALNKKTGETAMVYANPSDAPAGYTTPYFFEFEGIRVLILMTNATVEGYDAKTGKHLLSIPWRNRTGTNVTMPIYQDGHLFLSAGYSFGSKGFRLTRNADGTINAEELWSEQQFDNHHHGLVLVEDHVYGTSSGGNWFAINFLTGEVGYSVRPVGEQGSVHYADGMIYALSQNSRTVILWEPNPKEFIERGRFVLPKEADGKSWAHPVVINGRLYLRHAQHLYCYDVKAE